MVNKHNRLRQLIYWAQRVIGIIFCLFISLFALDVFNAGYTFRQTVTALFIHLIPTGIVVALLALPWKWYWFGGIAFSALGIYYLVLTHFRFPVVTYLVISGPLFLLSVLFIINWVLHVKTPQERA